MRNIALPITLVTPLDTRMPKTSYATPTQRASGTPSKMIDLFTPAMQSLRHAARGLAVAAVIGLMGASQGAWAHAHPVSSEPAAQASVDAPKSVRVTFDSALEGAFSTLTVVDAQGKPVTQTKAELDAARKTLTVALPPLKAGDYQANWVAVANDGHRTKGSFKFTVK